MLKKITIKKIILSSFMLLVIALLYLLPDDIKELDVDKEINYISIEQNKSEVYLLDKNGFVARTMIEVNSDSNIEEEAKTIINSLILGNENKYNIPNGFKPLIPSNTKLLSIQKQDKILKINFSNEFLNINKENEEKMIESLIYSITSIKGIDGIIIYIEDKLLTELPNSKKFLPSTLTKDYGINKEYDISTINNVDSINIYYVSKYNDDYYYVPVTKYVNESDNKIEVIIKHLVSHNSYETNLMSFLARNTELINYEVKDKQMTLEFNNSIVNDVTKMNILEEVKYTMFLSMSDNFDIDELVFKVDSVEIDKTNQKDID